MSMKILFMGTPDFALFSLRALVEAGENIIGVVTQPDKPKGRGYTLTPPPVKVYALEKNIPVYQPNTLRGEEFANLLAELSPDLIVVVAYRERAGISQVRLHQRARLSPARLSRSGAYATCHYGRAERNGNYHNDDGRRSRYG